MVLRAKTIDLFQNKPLTEKQKFNSDLNVKELQAGAVILKSFPRRVVLELTNTCNIKCIMCGRDEADFCKTMFDMSLLEKMHTVFEHAEEVTLFGWGEPTLHPEFANILKYIDGYPVRKYFVTNGTRLFDLQEALFKYNVDILAISLDGACADTNNKIRAGSDFDKIVSALKSIVKEKRKRNTPFPYINFVLTAMRRNLSEIPDMVRLAYEIGIDEVKVVYLTVFGKNLARESLWGYENDVKAVFDEAIEVSEKLGVKIKLPYLYGEDPAENKFHKDCFVGWRDFFIGSDGYVRPCQSTPIKLFPFSKYNSFFEMWNSIEYQDFRQKVNNFETMPNECKRCYQSSHANWNRKESFLQVGQVFAPDWKK